MSIVKIPSDDPYALLARIVKVKLPPAVGVPVSSPVVESSNPGGNEPLVTSAETGGAPPSVKAYE